MKSCLVIGKGPSIKYIDMNKKYDVDTIIGVHKALHQNTDIVVTVDISGFNIQEKIALDKGIPLVLGTSISKECTSKSGVNLDKLVHPKLKSYYDKGLVQVVERPKGNDTSGSFGIYYAITQGYDTIYTAGIDYYEEDNKPYNHYGHILNNFLKPYLSNDTSFGGGNVMSHNIKLYKCCEQSKLECEVKIPILK